MRWSGLLLLAPLGCTPGPPLPPRDTGFLLQLDTGAEAVPPLCQPAIPAPTEVIATAQSLDGAGPYFVCPSVPVTLIGDNVRVFVAEYATANLQGDRGVAYVKSGAQATATGAQTALVAEPQALVTVTDSTSAIEACDRIVWDPAFDRACP